jgi:hypothetical protein
VVKTNDVRVTAEGTLIECSVCGPVAVARPTAITAAAVAHYQTHQEQP